MSISKLRKSAGFTQKQLADLVEVDQAAVSNWELGKTRPHKKTLAKLAKVFDCNVDELLDPDTVIRSRRFLSVDTTVEVPE